METPGELMDKLSILKLRETRHPDPEARVEIQRQINLQTAELRLLKERVKAGLWPVGMLRMPKLKLRARDPKLIDSAQSLHQLGQTLGHINERMWINEDRRDRLVTGGGGAGSVAPGLWETDHLEQQLNQDRNAFIDAINEAAIKEWAP